MQKVALAYSGSLDAAICVHYLRHVRGMRVVTFSANLGQPEYLEPLAEQAVELGASAAHLADLRDRFAREYIFPCVRANAVYEQGYFLFGALSRPLIVEELVKIAEEEGCEYVAHGARGSGDDARRIENCMASIAPNLGILTPLIELGLRDPSEDADYARRNGIRFEGMGRSSYDVEQNLWGNNIHLRGARDTWEEAPPDAYILTTPPSEAPARAAVVEIDFLRGDPVAVDGEELSPVHLIDRLNKIGGRHAVGRFDVVENRINGAKSREIYESPAAAILMAAHRAIESISLDRDLAHFKEALSLKYADLVYEGRWFTPAREGLDAFFSKINEKVTGRVRLNLCRGALGVAGRRSSDPPAGERGEKPAAPPESVKSGR